VKFGLILRAYAPFKQFGVAFHGDNRGPTTSDSVTSRIKSWVEFDPVAGTLGSPHAKSDESSMVILPFRDTAVSLVKPGSSARVISRFISTCTLGVQIR
jgi:hypothetical protein